MFFTSLTTASAFLASGASPVLPIGTFGIFSGILVLVNYLSVIIYFPTVILTSHLYWTNWSCPCCKPCSTRTHSEEDLSKAVQQKESTITIFFRDKYFYFITHKYVKWVIIILFTGFTAFLAWSASRLKVGTGQVNEFHKFRIIKMAFFFLNR